MFYYESKKEEHKWIYEESLQAGPSGQCLALSAGLDCSGVIIAYCSTELLGSKDSLT